MARWLCLSALIACPHPAWAAATQAWRQPLLLAGYVLLVGMLVMTLVRGWERRKRIREGYFAQIREREERLKVALWASEEIFWDYDLSAGVMHRMSVEEASASDHAIDLFSEVDSEHQIHPDDLLLVRERMRAHRRGRVPFFLSEHRTRGPGDEWIWVRARGRVVERDDRGRALRIAGTARDITAYRSDVRDRRIASEVLRSMAEAVCVFDREFNFLSINTAFETMSGYSDGEVHAKSIALLDNPRHDAAFYREMRHSLAADGHWAGEIWQQRKDGSEFLSRMECNAVSDAAGEDEHYVAVLSDVTDSKRAEQELRFLANYDTLTNLPNRTLLSERLSQAIVNARREDTKVAVLFLDLDRFKDINDSLGHAAGDRILRASAARLREVAPATATVARLSGDEFTIVLEHVRSPDEGDTLARDIIRAFDAPLTVENRRDILISPTIGISLYPDHGQVPTDLLKHADTAMYQAKAAGRHTFLRYTEQMESEIRQRATLSGELRKVLDNGELRLVYQPRLSLTTGKITGVEALLRWEHPQFGEITPERFIPLAEESGMILPIGEWVLREACSTLKRWRQHGLQALTMSVNVSALQLLRGDLAGLVARLLDELKIPAGQLELELTESVVMTKAEQTAGTLHTLRGLGVLLAVDDFGTGYSSLAYLKRLPITTLKIDKAFIDDIPTSADDQAITSSIIAMARSLGLTVVAEGVEQQAQADFLRTQLCDEIQGYWLSQPLDPYRCLAFLRNWDASRLPLQASLSPA
ncbi:MAG: EAL domain-containing protein [Lysobacter sp.]|nr:EAL domain-containing protein [Lysobacter sp.]